MIEVDNNIDVGVTIGNGVGIKIESFIGLDVWLVSVATSIKW